MNSKSRSWFLDAAPVVVEELNIDHSDVFVLGLFCICIIIVILSFQLGGSLVAGGNESHVCQGKQKCLLSKLDICTAKFDICITPFVFSTLEH